jgi:hypothetical protein
VVSNVSTTTAQNVVFTITNSATLNISNFTVAINNGGVPTCFVNNAQVSCAAPGPIPAGATLTFTTPSLGGSTQKGAKPPQTMTIVETTNAPTAGAFSSTGTVTFGPGGTDTLNNSVTVNLTAK